MFMNKAKQGGGNFSSFSKGDFYFAWLEDSPEYVLDNIMTTGSVFSPLPTAGAVGVLHTVTVDSSVGFKIGDTLISYDPNTTTKIAYFRVSEVVSPTSVKIDLLNTTPGFNPASGSVLTGIGSAYSETADTPESMYSSPSKRYGSCQIQRDTFKMSRRKEQSREQYGEEFYYQIMKLAERHKAKIEYTLLWGYRPEGYDKPFEVADAITDAAGDPITMSMGLEQAIGFAYQSPDGTSQSRKIVWTRGNTLRSDLQVSMDRLFEYKSGQGSNKFMFGGIQLLTFFRALQEQNIVEVRTAQETSLGIMVTEIATDSGVLKFIEHPLMKGTNANKFFIIDDSCVEVNSLMAPVLKQQQKGFNTEILVYEYQSDCGLAVKLPNCHAAGIILD
jgi:hypothetical protein